MTATQILAKEPTLKLNDEIPITLLYFTASWCPPCVGFSPKFIKACTEPIKNGKIQVVIGGLDRENRKHEDYTKKFKEIGCHALPF